MSHPATAKQFPFTYHEYMLFPKDRNRHEIIEGKLFVTPSPKFLHQKISYRLSLLLGNHIERHGLGILLTAPMDVVLSLHNIVQPDLLFIAKGREKIITEDNIRGAPDLIIEIVSPTSASEDRIHKRQVYSRYGVRHYWIVDSDSESLEAYRLTGRRYRAVGKYSGADTFQSALFPSLSVRVAELWH